MPRIIGLTCEVCETVRQSPTCWTSGVIRERSKENIAAWLNQQLHEITSADILPPGTAALSDGVQQLQALIRGCAEARG